jgi:hypothetical protein
MEEVVNGIWRHTGSSSVYLIKTIRPWLVAGIESAADAEGLLKELERLEGDLSSQIFLFIPGHLDSKLIEKLATLAVLQDGVVVLPTIFFRPEVTNSRVRIPILKRFKRWWVGQTHPAKTVADEFMIRVKSGQRLLFANGWQVVFTAGYGRERVFLYHPDRKILVSGKAIVIEEGEASIALEADAIEEVSLLLADLKVETILPAQGGVVTGKFVLRDLFEVYSPVDF